MERRNPWQGIFGGGGQPFLAALGAQALPSNPEAAPGDFFNVRAYGAKGDGKTKDKAAIQKAIDDCSKSGGGVVYLPPGTYLTGTVLLKNDVNLHLSAGATILGSPDADDYSAPSEFQKVITWAVARHLILAYRQSNIALTGRGTVDGHNSVMMVPTKNPPIKPDDRWWRTAADLERVLRVSPMIMIVNCDDVLVEGLTLQNADGWTMRPMGCNRVVIRGVKVRNNTHTQNTDGIDPTSCEDVMISDCDIDTGDDGLCIKTDNPFGDNRVCRNVTVTNCIISSACSAFKVGSEGFEHFENITLSNSVLQSKESRREDERIIAAIDIVMGDGGSIEGLTISNVSIRNARLPFWIRLQNRVGHRETPMTSWLRSVMISNVQAFGARITSSILGIPGYPIEDVTLRNIRIQTEEPGKAEWINNVPQEREHGYPEDPLFGRMPAFGLYCRHVKGLNISDLDLVSNQNDPRPMLECVDVHGLSLNTLTGTPPSSGAESIRLQDVSDASISGNYPTDKHHVFVQVEGSKSADISFFGNDLYRVKTPIHLAADVPAGAVTVDDIPFTLPSAATKGQ